MKFRELQMAFTVRLHDDTIPPCLVCPYQIIYTGRRTTSGNGLWLFWLEKRGPTWSEVIFAWSIICGVLVFPAYGSNERAKEYIVFNVLDTDMFLHIRNYFK